MIVNPFRTRLEVVPNSRRLVEDFGLLGREFWCGDDLWQLQGLYAPVAGRAIGGVRARVYSSAGLMSFINQRDLEVLLGLAHPGTMCAWLGKDYPEPGSANWYGTYMDDEDHLDDLFEWEILLRQQYPGCLPDGIGLERPLQVDDDRAIVEYDVLVEDFDRRTGERPDYKHSTVGRRWARVEHRRFG